jgi:hypothetical protein
MAFIFKLNLPTLGHIKKKLSLLLLIIILVFEENPARFFSKTFS